MSTDEEVYIVEKDRQKRAQMPVCRCSNCEPAECKKLVANLKGLTLSNFETGLARPESLERLEPDIGAEDDAEVMMNDGFNADDPIVNHKGNGPPARRLELIQLAQLLVLTFQNHHEEFMNNKD